jgi:hypothetical protein
MHAHIQHSDFSISSNKMATVMVVTLIMVNLGMPLSHFAKLSPKVATFVTILGISLSMFLLAFGSSFWIYPVAFGVLNGLSIGFGYL